MPNQRWVQIAGLICGMLTLLFLMSIYFVSMREGYSISCDSRFILISILSFGAALSFSFIGGSAAANGQLPSQFMKNNPITFAVGGGIAVLLVVMIIGNYLWNDKSCRELMPNLGQYTIHIHISHNDQMNEAIAIRKALVDKGFNVPKNIDLVTSTPVVPDLRYFYEEDLLAAKIAAEVSRKGILYNLRVNPKLLDEKKSELHTLLIYFPRYENVE